MLLFYNQIGVIKQNEKASLPENEIWGYQIIHVLFSRRDVFSFCLISQIWLENNNIFHMYY